MQGHPLITSNGVAYTVPVLEIDGNVVINDTYDIHEYLMINYPGKGNSSLTNEQMSIQEEFIKTNLKWDEYLFSYRRLPKFLGRAMHQIRLVELSKAINHAAEDGLLDKKLMDGRTVRQAYIDKVAQTRSLIRIGCDNDTMEQLEKRIKANEEFMIAILKSADELLASHKLLLTDEIDEVTSADVYLAVLLTRIASVDNELLVQVFADHPKIERWWTFFSDSNEAATLKNDANSSKLGFLLSKGPSLILHGLGMLNPSPLPDDLEQEVIKELKSIMATYCNTS